MDEEDSLKKAIRIQPTSYSEFAQLARSAAKGVEALGIRYRGTRFQRYVEFLEEATRRTYPRSIDWNRDRSAQIYEAEAIGQCVQLASSLGLQGRVDPELLKERLNEIVSGRDVVDDEDADDPSRNKLLELTTGSMLDRQGFGVELIAAGEDLVLRVPDAPAVPIECKRPASMRSLERNVHKARRQLRSRLLRYPDGGVIVIGLDRAAGVSGKLARLENVEDIPAAVTEALREGALATIKVGGEKLRSVALAVVTVIAGAVFSSKPAMPTAVLRMTWAPVPLRGRRQAVAEQLAAAFKTRTGPPLAALIPK